MIGIIGGTGVYDAGEQVKEKVVQTPYGEVTVDLMTYHGQEIAFLSRHGKTHGVPPHKVNYRGNIYALKELGCKVVLATAAVGSMNPAYEPGDVVIITDFVDMTKSRTQTFFEGDTGVHHVELSDPYCHVLRSALVHEGPAFEVNFKGDAVYVCTEGPRFETAAEIRHYQTFGDVVGMTNVPEVVLAKEAGLHYAAVGIITNWCTGISGEIGLHDIEAAIGQNKKQLTKLFMEVGRQVTLTSACHCESALISL